MDLLSRIASWLGENEATISAVVGITVLAGVVFAGLRSLVRRRGEATQEKATSVAPESASTAEASASDLDPLTVPGFEGHPAIAVLAFDNLSGDPDQEYFADGIAEDLITRLSAWRDFPVIARNSSFTYKGKAVDVKQVSRELGVRYVVEGSVRKVADRVRISAQLIDATTGGHVWAEKYDRELRDIFALQDEISEAIAGAMSPELLQSEVNRAARKESHNLDAWDCVARGFWHCWRFTREDNSTARSFFARATELDSNSLMGFVGLALTHYLDTEFQWSDSPAQSVSAMVEASKRSIAVDDKSAFGHLLQGWAYSLTGQREKMITAFELATQIDPSFAEAYRSLGFSLAWANRTEEAVENLRKAMRLSPHDPLSFLFFVGMSAAHFAAERYEEAASWAERAIQRSPDFRGAHVYLAASYAHLDRTDEARSAIQEIFRINPVFTLSTLRTVLSAATPAFVERLIDGLRKAGLPE
jgi:adenylate cyclase